MSRQILQIQPGALLACPPAHGGWPVGERFAPDQAKAFAAYLRRHGDDDFLLLVDLPGEEWQSETLPALRGGDRRQLLARRLARLFPPPQLALVNRRDRRNDREHLLFASLGDELNRLPWLPALQAAGSALRGIWSIAQLAAPLHARLRPQAARGLLFCQHAQGWRASWIADGQTVFSRRCAASAGDPGAQQAAEARQIEHFLRGRRELADDAPLSLTVLGEIDGTALAAWPTEVFCPSAAAGRCRLAASDVDALCRALLARRPPSAQFATPEQRLGARLAGLRRWLGGSALAALGTAAGYALLVAAPPAGPEPLPAAQPQAIPAPPSPLVQARIATYRQLQARRGGPGEFWRSLGQTLLDFPDLHLDELDWRAADDDGPTRLDWRGEFVATAAADLAERRAALLAALNDAGFDVAWRAPAGAAPGDGVWRGGDAAPAPERRLAVSLRRRP